MAIPSQYLALFKEWYAEDGLRDQINNERLLYDLAKKNPRKNTEKLTLKKYDPVARKHVPFRESKIK